MSISYTLKDFDGVLLDSNREGAPLAYIQGHGNIIPGLEEQLSGKTIGDSIEVKLTPDKAYGERNPQLETKIPRSSFPEGADLQVAMQFEAQSEQGSQIFMIKEVHEDHIIADGNHPMAGKSLHFEVDVIGVRAASSDELAHGHVHGPGGHHH